MASLAPFSSFAVLVADDAESDNVAALTDALGSLALDATIRILNEAMSIQSTIATTDPFARTVTALSSADALCGGLGMYKKFPLKQGYMSIVGGKWQRFFQGTGGAIFVTPDDAGRLRKTMGFSPDEWLAAQASIVNDSRFTDIVKCLSAMGVNGPKEMAHPGLLILVALASFNLVAVARTFEEKMKKKMMDCATLKRITIETLNKHGVTIDESTEVSEKLAAACLINYGIRFIASRVKEGTMPRPTTSDVTSPGTPERVQQQQQSEQQPFVQQQRVARPAQSAQPAQSGQSGRSTPAPRPVNPMVTPQAKERMLQDHSKGPQPRTLAQLSEYENFAELVKLRDCVYETYDASRKEKGEGHFETANIRALYEDDITGRYRQLKPAKPVKPVQ